MVPMVLMAIAAAASAVASIEQLTDEAVETKKKKNAEKLRTDYPTHVYREFPAELHMTKEMAKLAQMGHPLARQIGRKNWEEYKDHLPRPKR